MLELFKRPNFVLLACQPKCASTFFTNALAALPNSRSVRLVPGYDRREQELSRVRFRRYRFRTPRNLIAQAHVRRSIPTDELIDDYGVNVVVMTRNPFDTVVSLRDHIRNESERFPFAYFTDDHRQMSDDDLDMAIVRFVLPWVISFRMSWKDHPTAQFVDYDDFQNDKIGVLSDVAAKAGIIASREGIELAYQAAVSKNSRQNLGLSGRGQHLSKDAKRAIAELVLAYTGGRPQPGLEDFRPSNDVRS